MSAKEGLSIMMKDEGERVVLEIPLEKEGSVNIHSTVENPNGAYNKLQTVKHNKVRVFPEPVIKERIARVKRKDESKKPEESSEPTLAEQMVIIKRWWILIDNG